MILSKLMILMEAKLLMDMTLKMRNQLLQHPRNKLKLKKRKKMKIMKAFLNSIQSLPKRIFLFNQIKKRLVRKVKNQSQKKSSKLQKTSLFNLKEEIYKLNKRLFRVLLLKKSSDQLNKNQKNKKFRDNTSLWKLILTIPVMILNIKLLVITHLKKI
jgi:hypothetical protein